MLWFNSTVISDYQDKTFYRFCVMLPAVPRWSAFWKLCTMWWNECAYCPAVVVHGAIELCVLYLGVSDSLARLASHVCQVNSYLFW